MIPYLEGYGGKYEVFRENLTDNQIRRVFFEIVNSDRFDLGEQSHIILRGTDKIVGYIGNDSVELCCPLEEMPELYRVPHKHLKKIFRAATNKIFHDAERVAA